MPEKCLPIPRKRQAQPIEAASNPAALLQIATVKALAGLSRSTIYDRIAKGTFPAPSARLSSRCVRWRASEITAWLDAQTQGAAA